MKNYLVPFPLTFVLLASVSADCYRIVFKEANYPQKFVAGMYWCSCKIESIVT